MSNIGVNAVVSVSPKLVAEMFCMLGDEDQAQCFVEIGRIAETWRSTGGSASYQFWLVGKHLSTCACSTPEAREIVDNIAEGIRDGREAGR